MLAANVWHWWIGVALVLLSVGAVLAFVVGYIATVPAKRHPGRSQKSPHHTDL